jgi:thiol:disulfide interchange protein
MNRTRVLVGVAVLVALVQLFPDRVRWIELAAVIGAAAYFIQWAAATHLARFRLGRREAAQAAADEQEYRRYQQELDEIRARHDAERDVNDPTSISPEYKSALSALHDRHEAMLTRKFGPR